MAISLTGLARAFGRLASAAEGTDEARVAAAITHPSRSGSAAPAAT